MEFIVWLVFAMGGAWCILSPFKVIAFFQNLFNYTPKPVVQRVSAPEQDFTNWKTLVDEGKQYKKAQHTEWVAEYKAIIQKHCSPHLYHHQHWYTCINCGYEEPWEYKEGCGCTYSTVTTLTSATPEYVLTGERASWCSVHGVDFTCFPISDRTSGKYGPSNDRTGGVERSRELTKKHPVRKINYEFENNK
jgi:hypothetical protein